MAEKYSYLLVEYPQKISANQLYRICHISKRKAKWLLDNGKIPCQDSGKKTRRYTIDIRDLIEYLEYVETHPEESRTPIGLFTSKHRPSQKVIQISAAEIECRLQKEWADEPDALTTDHISAITGYCVPTINRWIRSEQLRSIKTPMGTIVAKEWLIPFMAQYLLSDHIKISSALRRLVTEEYSE